jgi:arylsulfatase
VGDATGQFGKNLPPSQGADTLSMRKAIENAMKKLDNPRGSSN